MLGLDPRWWSEIGLMLDLLAFALLSLDLIAALRNERQNLDDILRLEGMAFTARYGFFAPPHEEVQKENAEFERAQAAKRAAALKGMERRRVIAYVAILLAAIGFAMQLVGGWPT